MSIEPVFIFSLTRSGSTLLQRVLGSYDEISTATEPYVLLPSLYALRRDGVWSEYTHYLAAECIEDFAEELPNGLDDYRAALRDMVLRLYSEASDPGARYFLDKTPAYFFIVDDIIRLFPDSKFIFLWRNPLHVVSSLIRFRDGLWDPASYRDILFTALPRLVAAYQQNQERACSVRYEDLVGGDTSHWERLMSYLEMEFDPASLSRFAGVELKGRGGDPTGVKQYSALSTEPLSKWTTNINNPLRTTWAKRYLRWLGRDRLAVAGYDLEELLADLDSVERTHHGTAGDVLQLARSLVKEPLRLRARRSLGLNGTSGLRHVLQ
jgi:sulfotransferase family protein